jgi:hypothetical protein
MNVLKGILLKLASALMFAVMQALVRLLARRYQWERWCPSARCSRSFPG